MQDIRVWTNKTSTIAQTDAATVDTETHTIDNFWIYSSQKVFRVQAGVGCVYCPD